MARCKYQKGTLFMRGKRVQKWIGRWVDGGVHKSVVLGTVGQLTRQQAQRELERRLLAVNDPVEAPVQPQPTFGEFAEQWRAAILPNHKPSTQSSERSHLGTLIPIFGASPLSQISCREIQQFVSSAKLAPKSVKNLVGTMQIMWNTAKAWGYVSHDPFQGLVLPRPNAQPQIFYAIEQAKQIVDRAPEPYKTMFWIVAETGIRGGELCGLGVDDLDLDNQTITVWRSAWHGQLQTPKTANAVRRFSISPELAEHVRQYLQTGWRDNAHRLLFITRHNGGVYWNDEIVRRVLWRITRELGLPRAGLHALRHSNATLLDRMNAPVRVRLARLGHSKFATTMNYTHLQSEDDRRIAGQIGKFFAQVLPKTETAQAARMPKPFSINENLVAGGGFEPPTFGL